MSRAELDCLTTEKGLVFLRCGLACLELAPPNVNEGLSTGLTGEVMAFHLLLTLTGTWRPMLSPTSSAARKTSCTENSRGAQALDFFFGDCGGDVVGLLGGIEENEPTLIGGSFLPLKDPSASPVGESSMEELEHAWRGPMALTTDDVNDDDCDAFLNEPLSALAPTLLAPTAGGGAIGHDCAAIGACGRYFDTEQLDGRFTGASCAGAATGGGGRTADGGRFSGGRSADLRVGMSACGSS
eukprot:5386214-Pleurochrysis_carterae.AAC.1